MIQMSISLVRRDLAKPGGEGQYLKLKLDKEIRMLRTEKGEVTELYLFCF